MARIEIQLQLAAARRGSRPRSPQIASRCVSRDSQRHRLEGAALLWDRSPSEGLSSRDAVWKAVDTMRENGSTIVLTTHYLEEAQQRADRIGLMHEGAFHREGTVSELTKTLPSLIRFSLLTPTPAPPMHAVRERDGIFVIETFRLNTDLKALLSWAEDHDIELQNLSAGPTRLEDVFRAMGADVAAA